MRKNWRSVRQLASLVSITVLALILGGAGAGRAERILLQPLFAWLHQVADR